MLYKSSPDIDIVNTNNIAHAHAHTRTHTQHIHIHTHTHTHAITHTGKTCNNGTRQSILIMGEHSFEVTHLKCLPGQLFILKLVFAQVHLTPLSSIHTDTLGGRI